VIAATLDSKARIMTKPRMTTRLLAWVTLAAIVGIAIFGLMAWRSVTVEQAETDEALRRFTEIRAQFAGSEPVLRVEPDGRVMRSREPPGEGRPPKYFRVLAYRIQERQLVRADVAWWFLKAKGPAVKYSLRGTGLDLDRLGISPFDLARYGPSLVLDETRADGSRLLVWTD
jgi:hypothetical protein